MKNLALFKGRMTLFWRLFLSLLLTIIFTAISSVLIERWLNERALNARMEWQIEQLLAKRELLVAALEAGEISVVKQLYQQDRRFMHQISIYDEQGVVLFPRYGRMQRHRNRAPSTSMSSPTIRPTQSQIEPETGINEIERANTLINTTDRPELADTVVILPDRTSVILQIRPNLPFAEIVALQRGNFIVRLILIVLFSTLVSFWLSRTMIGRMRDVQHTVRQLIEGNYQANPNLSKLGDDELGLLAKDVGKLSLRLADSELARKQMLSDISHELRSPLARLDVATELTRDFAPHASRYLDRIDKESARMNELIEHIIHIQSLQMQQYRIDHLESETVDLSEIISEIGKDVCFEFQHKNVRWRWQPPNASLSTLVDSSTTASDTSWTVQGNQEQLHSALENVIRNAFMHTAADSMVTVEMAKVQIDNKIPAIQLSVTDEGGGIVDKDLERIFQPFVRLDSARHRQTGGYGLGLAIVHAVIMAHKGQISVYNRRDNIQGLVVKIVLPT